MSQCECKPLSLITHNLMTNGMIMMELRCMTHGKIGEVGVSEHMAYPNSPERIRMESELREIWKKHVSSEVETNPLELPVHLL